MEYVVQWLDNLDDTFYAGALLAERARLTMRTIAVLLLALMTPVAAVAVSLQRPPLGIGLLSLLVVALLYRGAVHGRPAVDRYQESAP